MLAQAERLREDLGAYAGGLAGQVRVLSNTNALTEFLPEALERVPGRPSQRQRRSRGAADRRDRRPDRRGRRRHRHRRRHGRCRARSTPIRSAATASCWWWRAIIRWRGAPRSASPRCSTTTSSASTARARCSASSPTRPAASAGRCGCACSCAASTRSAGWSSAMSASASCRRPPRARARQDHGDQGGRARPTPGRCAT